MDEVFYQTFVPAMQVALLLSYYAIQICTLINHISEKLMVFQILLRASMWPDVAVGLVGMRLLDLVLALSMLVSPNQLTSTSRSCTNGSML